MPFAEFKTALATYTGTVVVNLGGTSYTFPASDLQTALGIPVPPAEGNFGTFRVKTDGSASPYLRVRDNPAGTEIGKLYPGDTLTLIVSKLETAVLNGVTYQWGKIRKGTLVGWVAWSLAESTATIPTSVNKVGLHLMGTLSEDNIRKAAAQNATVYKSVDNPEALRRMIAAVPGATFIYRRWEGSDRNPDDYIRENGGVDGAVATWISSMTGLFSQLPAEVYFESFNEQGASANYCAFEAARARALYRMGRRACLLNIATGNTEESTWQTARDMVQTAIQVGAIIGIHGYSQSMISAAYGGSGWVNGQWQGALWPSPNRTDGSEPPVAWHSCRFERDFWYLRKMGLGDAKLVITELGLDDMVSEAGYPAEWRSIGKPRGWNDGRNEVIWRNRNWVNASVSKEQFYRQQLVWQNMIMNREKNLLGAAVFTYGTDSQMWVQFDVRSAL